MAGLRDLSMNDAVFKSEQSQNNGIYNTQNNQELRVNNYIWIMWCHNHQKEE